LDKRANNHPKTITQHGLHPKIYSLDPSAVSQSVLKHKNASLLQS
jgi:hypothetical protein